MNLIIDANILASALIKDGINRELIVSESFNLYSPDFIIEEIIEHLGEFEQKTKLNREKLIFNFKELLRLANIRLINKNLFADFINPAIKISPDICDVAYFALALKLNCPIWSNDKLLKMQDKVKIYSTEEIFKLNL